MAYGIVKTEHNGSKKGQGAFYGIKALAKKWSSHIRRARNRAEEREATLGSA